MQKKTNLVKRGRVSTDGHKWGVDGYRWMGGHRRAGKRVTEGHGGTRKGKNVHALITIWPGNFPKIHTCAIRHKGAMRDSGG